MKCIDVILDEKIPHVILVFPEHTNELNSCQGCFCSFETLKSLGHFGFSFYAAMVGLDNVVEVFDLADFDVGII